MDSGFLKLGPGQTPQNQNQNSELLDEDILAALDTLDVMERSTSIESSIIIPVKAPETSKIKERCNLLSLPAEIISQIARLLRRPTAACFTFTCKTVMNAVGKRYWDQFRRDLKVQRILIRHWRLNSGRNSNRAILLKFPTLQARSVETLNEVTKQCSKKTCLCYKHWNLFHENLKARRQLLALLVRDLPYMVRCGRCFMLHRRLKRVSPTVGVAGLRDCEIFDIGVGVGVGDVLYKGFM